MAPKTPTGVPTSALAAGDTWKWRVADLADYPNAEGWTLKYEAAGLGRYSLPGLGATTVTYVTSGDDAGYWVVTVPTTATAGLIPGRYRLIGRMVGSGTYAGLEYPVSDDVLVIQADPRVAADQQYQTFAEKMLALIEAELLARTTGTGSSHESYQIEGRAITKISLTDLTGLRGKYAALVKQERTGTLGRQVKTAFNPVSDD